MIARPLRSPAGKLLAASLCLLAFSARGLAEEASSLPAIYEEAYRQFQAASYEEALRQLDRFDALVSPADDQLESLNLRGAILTRQHDFVAATSVLEKALALDPERWSAHFNLGEISFLQGMWSGARCEFEATLTSNRQIEEKTRALIRYKILLTYVLEGDDENTQRVLAEIERSGAGPDRFFGAAAVARAAGKLKEAKKWMAQANNIFPRSLNNLYAESFYEVGWESRGEGESNENYDTAPQADRTARLSGVARRAVDQAEEAFLQHQNAVALEYLDAVDAAAAQTSAGDANGVEERLQDSVDALQAALAARPSPRGMEFAAAEAEMKTKKYREARDRLERLFAATPEEKSRAAEWLRFEVFMTLLLDKKESEAQAMIDRFGYVAETPARYYSEAAWAFQHGRDEQAHDWIASAQKIYSPALNHLYANSLEGLGDWKAASMPLVQQSRDWFKLAGD